MESPFAHIRRVELPVELERPFYVHEPHVRCFSEDGGITWWFMAKFIDTDEMVAMPVEHDISFGKMEVVSSKPGYPQFMLGQFPTPDHDH